MVVYKLLANNEFMPVVFQANSLPPLKRNYVTPFGLQPSTRTRQTGSKIESRSTVSSDLLMTLLLPLVREYQVGTTS